MMLAFVPLRLARVMVTAGYSGFAGWPVVPFALANNT